MRALLSGVFVVLALTGCGLVSSGDEVPTAHPVIEALTVNGSSETVIIERTQTVTLEVKVSSTRDISEVVIEANGEVLRTFSQAPYSYDWQVEAEADEVYDFTVIAEDDAGGVARAQYPNRLAVNVR